MDHSEAVKFKRLWQMVVIQAIMDAISRSKDREEIYHHHEAKRWIIEGNNKDFYMVCDLADLSPSRIKNEALKAIESGKRMRCESGKSPNYMIKKHYRMKMEQRKELLLQELIH